MIPLDKNGSVLEGLGRAGLDVLHSTGANRSYSIASMPTTPGLELHLRQVPGGLLGSWLHGLQPGADLRVRGAFGQCFYVDDDAHKRLLLIGAGTGLARLAGSLENTRAVLWGDPEIVRVLQRSLSLAGIASSEILADAFESPPAKVL